jgi:DNA-binding MarR family transcriptional regulator
VTKARDAQNDYPLEPALDFLQHLWQLNHALERMSLQMERRLGVTAQQRLFIRCIGKYPGITASELAAVLHLDRGTVSVALRRLGKKGMVSRRRNAKDHRRVALDLTPRGQAIDQPDPETVEYAVERMLAKAGRSDVERVKGVLARLSENLSEMLGPPSKR